MNKFIKPFKYIVFLLVMYVGFTAAIPVVFGQGAQPAKGLCVTAEKCEALGGVQNEEYDFVLNAGGCAGTLGICTPKLEKFGVHLEGASIEDYINSLFRFLMGAAGVVALTMIVLGGYGYITSAGNQARVSRSKEFIRDALIGLVLVFGGDLG